MKWFNMYWYNLIKSVNFNFLHKIIINNWEKLVKAQPNFWSLCEIYFSCNYSISFRISINNTKSFRTVRFKGLSSEIRKYCVEKNMSLMDLVTHDNRYQFWLAKLRWFDNFSPHVSIGQQKYAFKSLFEYMWLKFIKIVLAKKRYVLSCLVLLCHIILFTELGKLNLLMLVLSSSQFWILPQLPQNLMLVTKIVKTWL